MEVKLDPPPGDSLEQPSPGTGVGEDASGDSPEPSFSIGPVLYAGIRDGDSASIVPVAELTADGLRAFPQGDSGLAYGRQLKRERLGPGSEFILFDEGSRIGTLTLERSLDPGGGYCPPRPRGAGLLELVPSAVAAEHFLALEGPLGRPMPFTPYRTADDTYTERAASLNLAGAALNEIGAPWPPSLVDIRQDLRVFRLAGDSTPAVVATFLFRDRLEVAPVGSDAYSLLILGESADSRYRRTFTWYRPVEGEGKGAPRYFSRMDWNRDGKEEILLEVMGTRARWWAALARGSEGWTLSFQDGCEAPVTGVDAG
jgi:hypothetical protein